MVITNEQYHEFVTHGIAVCLQCGAFWQVGHYNPRPPFFCNLSCARKHRDASLRRTGAGGLCCGFLQSDEFPGARRIGGCDVSWSHDAERQSLHFTYAHPRFELPLDSPDWLQRFAHKVFPPHPAP